MCRTAMGGLGTDNNMYRAKVKKKGHPPSLKIENSSEGVNVSTGNRPGVAPLKSRVQK